jgi:hypothetical protein
LVRRAAAEALETIDPQAARIVGTPAAGDD